MYILLVLLLCTVTCSTVTIEEQEVCRDVQERLPIISLKASREIVAEQIGQASRDVGFFYVVDHDVPYVLVNHLVHLSRNFFALPTEMKREIS